MTTKRMLDEVQSAIEFGKERNFDTTGLENVLEEINKREYGLSDNKNTSKLKAQALESAKSCGYTDHTYIITAADEIYQWLIK